MKICWDNLDGVYLTTHGNLRKENTTYIEVDCCEVCGDTFLQASGESNVFCGHSCAQIGMSDEHREKLSKRFSGEKHPMYGKHHSEGAKRKMVIAQTGDKHWNWRGGSEPGSRATSEYKLWRKCICERDNYTCKMCGITKSVRFNAHHIFRWIDYPEFRFEIWNGITLCEECHRKTYNKEELYIEQFLKINFRKEN